ncbi:ABC transporter permease [Curvivirga aplysinae]|uniref:ABC transporter permease n=1 Tax=Curvivirga aplysinae TaxID=2529852 RepID=UPI0012BC52EF|nr:ABC transporter permease [Curvivirga aplysinae]MTI10150.1 ABC transporter permease [Curvivirga aplysinae]
MAIATDSSQPLTTADGTPLRQSLRRAERLNKLRAFGLVAPLFLFILVFFVFPIAKLASVSVDNSIVPEILTNTVEAIQDWDGTDLPPEPVWKAMAADLVEGKKNRNIAKVGKRLNFEKPGFRRLLIKSARKADKLEAPYKESLIKANKKWADPEFWRVLQRESGDYTFSYILRAVDMTYSEEGSVTMVDDKNAVYLDIFGRTLFISAQVTLTCLLLGFPIAYLLSTLPAKTGNMLMIFVLLPFWISLLVRTTAWIVLLQDQGVINSALIGIGVINEPLELIRNRVGVVVAMTHILLPFMILPLYSVMKGINPSLMRAAKSMGANPAIAFWRVYTPLTVPGIGAGGLLVFIISIGYYITPALVGGPKDIMASQLIDIQMNQQLNWNMASAIGVVLLAITLVLFAIYNRLVGIDRMKMG